MCADGSSSVRVHGQRPGARTGVDVVGTSWGVQRLPAHDSPPSLERRPEPRALKQVGASRKSTTTSCFALQRAHPDGGVGEVERTKELDWGLLVRRTVHSGSSHNYEERNAPCFPLHKSQRRFLPLALAACGSMSEQMTRQSMRNAFMIRILYLGRSGGPGELEQLQGVGASRVARPRFP